MWDLSELVGIKCNNKVKLQTKYIAANCSIPFSFQTVPYIVTLYVLKLHYQDIKVK